jgi:leader peptidase (prepilin peptidase)/N-methyltransferase
MPAEIVELLRSSPALFAAIVFLFGLLIGSFLNVVIYRLPVMMDREWRRQCAELAAQDAPASRGGASKGGVSALGNTREKAKEPAFNLVTPRSRCPACQAPIHAWQNVPVVSYLLLRGRCANCKAKISARYPVVELATAILSAVVAWHFGFGWAALGGLLFTWYLIALSGIDVDHQLLPDSLTLSLLWLGLIASLFHAGSDTGFSIPADPRSSIIGAAGGYLSLWLVFHVFRLITGKEGMGYGDFKLFAAFGAWFGWQILPMIILLSAFTGAVIGIVLIALRRRGREVPIPFGPYLAAAGWIALLWGPQIVDRYLDMAGMRGM